MTNEEFTNKVEELTIEMLKENQTEINKDKINEIINAIKTDREELTKTIETKNEELTKNNDLYIAQTEELAKEKSKYSELQNKYITAFNSGKEKETETDTEKEKNENLLIDDLYKD